MTEETQMKPEDQLALITAQCVIRINVLEKLLLSKKLLSEEELKMAQDQDVAKFGELLQNKGNDGKE